MRAMINKNLETADTIAKLVLASSTILLFMTGLIAGPFAVALVMVSVLLLLIFAAKQMFGK